MTDGRISTVVFGTLGYVLKNPSTKLKDNLQAMFEKVWSKINDCGNGCIQLELDEYIRTETDRRLLIEVIQLSERWITSFVNEYGDIRFGDAVTPLYSACSGNIQPAELVHKSYEEVLSVLTSCHLPEA